MIREGRTLDHPPVAEGHPRAGEKKPLRPVFARPARLLWLPALECNPANPRAATLLSNSSVAKNSFSLPGIGWQVRTFSSPLKVSLSGCQPWPASTAKLSLA